MSILKTNTTDISSALRLQGWLNEIRNIGYMIGGLFLLLGFVYWYLFIVVLGFIIANILLAKAKLWACVVLIIISVAMAIWFEYEYRLAMETIEQSISHTRDNIGRFGSTKDMQRDLARFSHYTSYFWGGLSLFYLLGLGLTVQYQRFAPKVILWQSWQQYWKLQLRLFRARLCTKGTLYWILVWICFAGAFTPMALSFFSVLGDPAWYFPVITLIGVVAGLRLMKRAKSYASLSVAAMAKLDERQPILLLRSFEDDLTPIMRTVDHSSWMRSLIAPTQWTLEESIEKSLSRHGPLIAIGRPGEDLPPAGAAREYIANDQWQLRVKKLISHAQAVVVILGDTPGLQFEYKTLKRLAALSKVIAVFPPASTEKLAASWNYFTESALEVCKDDSICYLDFATIIAAVISTDGRPHFVTCTRRNDEDCYRLAIDSCLGALERNETRNSESNLLFRL